MKLHTLSIKGFRRLQDVTIDFGDATFFIGENNAGKSGFLQVLDILLSGQNKLSEHDYYSISEEYTGEDGKPAVKNKRVADKVVFEAEFRDVPLEARQWRGFKGRLFSYNVPEDSEETGIRVYFRKIFNFGSNAEFALKQFKRTRKTDFENIKKPRELIEAGIDQELVKELFGDIDKNIPKAQEFNLELIDDIWEVSEKEEEWFKNAGGIIGNIISKLPRYLLIPANDNSEELSNERSGVLAKTMAELFKEVRDASPNYTKAQEYLDKLSKELDPHDDDSEFGKMMIELNSILDDVFPDTKIHSGADLADPDDVLKPKFNIKLSSNIVTSVDYQGTGVIRAAVFALLRFRKRWDEKRQGEHGRGLIIGFEEPELYLHPNAANQMRDTIYDLATSSSQIACTTHSPYMIDLSKKPRQVLNNFNITDAGVKVIPFNVSESFLTLAENDKTYVKMVLKMDDYLSRVFFARKVIIVEGDTEDIVLRETFKRISKEVLKKIKAEVQIVKARGKGTIISMVKYFQSMGLNVFVMHDRDQGTAGAEAMNNPILDALGSEDKRIMLEECIEDVLGYAPLSNEKPFKAYQKTLTWGNKWEDIPINWRNIITKLFKGYI